MSNSKISDLNPYPTFIVYGQMFTQVPIILGGPDFHTFVAGNEDIVAGDEAPMAPQGFIADVGNVLVDDISDRILAELLGMS